MNNKSTIFSKYTIFLCLGIIAVMAAIYLGMAYQMKLERQSVTGLLYSVDKEAAKKYADTIMLDNVNNLNAADGVDAMIDLGYADTAFINNANRYPVNWIIVSALVGIIFIFVSLIIYDRKNKKYIDELTDFKNRYHIMQKRMDGMNASLIQKNTQTRVFIENVAHQIRTPISYVYLTLDENIEKSREMVIDQNDKIIECIKCIDKINNLLSRLLKISRLESGKVLMEKVECDIAAFLCDICQEYSASRIHFTLHTISPVENIVYIDPEWFREAIVNILNNAMEHSDEDVLVHVALTIDLYKVNISITNCGEDISESDIPFIFDRFYTAENVLYSHTGIGLNLSNLIISQHHGNIKLTSKNRHTEFLINLPKYTFTSKYEPTM